MSIWPLPRVTFRQLSTFRETRPTALLTQPATWANIRSQIELPIEIQAEPARLDRAYLEGLGNALPTQIGVIYGIGNDTVIEAAKMIGYVAKRPVVIVPTTFGSDAAFSWTTSIKGAEGMETLTTGAAEEVIVNWSILADANPYERGAGITEIISSVTAIADWRLAQTKNATTPETRLVTWAMQTAAVLSMQAMTIAPQVGQGAAEALRSLLDLFCLSEQLDSVLGHRRASRGAEHIFADVVHAEEHVMYAEKVAAGILFAAALHDQDVGKLRDALSKAGVRLNQLSHSAIRTAANKLPDYVQQHKLPYTILNEADPDAIRKALDASTLLQDA